MVENYLIYVGDGEHFKNSSSRNIWGINSKIGFSKGFITNVKEGDLLWFVKSKSKGLIIAVATFTCLKKRETGPLIALTLTNEELGWTKFDGNWDFEVHYTNLYNISSLELYSEIKGACGIRRYNDNCKCDLPTEYSNIVRYSKVERTM